MYQRADPARPQETVRLPRVRQALHTAKPAGRDDGVGGRRVRRLLPVWPLSRYQRLGGVRQVGGTRPQMREAILRKARESADLMVSFFDANAETLERCVEAVAE